MEDRRTDNKLRERIAVLETQLHEMARQHVAMASDIRIIRDTLAQATGGWKVMMLVGGSAGAIGAFLGKWLSTIMTGVPK